MTKKTEYKPHEFETWADLRRGDFKRYKRKRAVVLRRSIAALTQQLATDKAELDELATAKS